MSVPSHSAHIVVAKSPAPSTVNAIDRSNGDQKNALAMWARWCSTG